MPETAVADTGPILHLAETGDTGLLDMFQFIAVSEHVRAELIRHGIFDSITDTLADRLRIERVSSQEMGSQLGRLLQFKVHRTDLSTVALASRIRPDVVLTDDLELRKALESQGYQVVGSVGVLFRAFRVSRLGKTDLIARLDRLLDGSTLYTSKGFRSTLRKTIENLPD